MPWGKALVRFCIRFDVQIDLCDSARKPPLNGTNIEIAPSNPHNAIRNGMRAINPQCKWKFRLPRGVAY